MPMTFYKYLNNVKPHHSLPTMIKKILFTLGYLVMTATLGFAIYYYALNPNSPLKQIQTDYSGLSTQALFAAKFPNQNGVMQDMSQYKGKIVVLNFWASWCPPCREEMPELNEIHTQYQAQNVVVVGIAAEELADMRTFSLSSPVNYPIMAADMEAMSLASLLGNSQGGLPYTVIINAEGQVAFVYLGRISTPQVKADLSKILQKSPT